MKLDFKKIVWEARELISRDRKVNRLWLYQDRVQNIVRNFERSKVFENRLRVAR